ncbi:hypothetical protein ACOT81_39560 [Streptomyces sp. WI04-05B]|uniref:Uncharacterized protein n=1 Tax=Streptomyces turgidiscabies (strain Car8) TaxID=698760 RepID=L7F4U5_STRT8|nr:MULTISPECIES: hypothetical protein [unclassified Streptomyces]ELP66347.1 hypothetical protein STRTUCAR8_01767 [Streptomyces turgidiscabies Car8]MDX2548233.1 hypothetical protein [Streptomyces sp. WI04-05B]MDX2590270.1 hypothetical protein [Streptomyces sp. WI04-05A]
MVMVERTETPAVRPWPLVEWHDVLSAYTPTDRPTEGRLRTLRRNDIVSEGVQGLLKARAGRFSGKLSLFCELNLDAAVLSRRGLAEMAGQYRSAASTLEESLRKLLVEHSVQIAELMRPTEPRRREAWHVLLLFSEAVSEAREHLPPVPDEDAVPGILEARTGQWVRFVASVGTGRYDVPWQMVRSADLSVGDPAVLFRELLPNGNAVLRLQAGLDPRQVEQADDVDEELDPLEARALRRPQPQAARATLLASLEHEEPLARRVLG